jgi:hypothetical protein
MSILEEDMILTLTPNDWLSKSMVADKLIVRDDFDFDDNQSLCLLLVRLCREINQEARRSGDGGKVIRPRTRSADSDVECC